MIPNFFINNILVQKIQNKINVVFQELKLKKL